MNENEIALKRHIPKGYVSFDCSSISDSPDNDLLIYSNEDKTSAICYTKKSFNHLWYYRFKDFEQMLNRVKATVESRIDRKARVKERRAKRYQPHTLKVNDILVCSWGYDQTNIDFYKIKELIGKNKVSIVKMSNTFTEQKGPYGDKVMPHEEIGEPFTKLINSEYNSISVYSFASASKWDGNPTYQTDPSFGH